MLQVIELAKWPDGGRVVRVVDHDGERYRGENVWVSYVTSDDKLALTWKIKEIREEVLTTEIFDDMVGSKVDAGTTRSRFLWFLIAATPPEQVRGPVSRDLVFELGFPRWVDARIAERLGPGSALGRPSEDGATVLELMAEACDELARLTGLGFKRDPGVAGDFLFPIGDNPDFWLTYKHAGHSLKTSSMAEQLRYPAHIREKAARMTDPPARWVLMDDGHPCGVGRTPLEALSDLPQLVWPGREEEWMAAHTEPGELTFEVDVWHMLGELSPAWWSNERLSEWARSGECQIVPLDART